MYDIFYVSSLEKQKNKNWKKFNNNFPISKYVTSFDEAREKSLTKFFWVVWDETNIIKKFEFDYIPDKWSSNYVHVFKNGKYYDDICLVPKHLNFSQKEIENRFFVSRKEVDIVASKPKVYDQFVISNYNDYLNAAEKSTTTMFWAIWDDSQVDEFDFKYQVPYYDRNTAHIFKNGKYYDGICLLSKTNIFSQKEIENRFFVSRKEVDIVASKPTLYDIVFISYQEPNADENYKRLLDKYPSVKRIHGVKGIHQAHIEAAKLCNTDMFWIVDGDAVLEDNFDFNYQVAQWDKETVHVWRSQNPINDLVYGYGGIKLFPRSMTINMDISKPDMTTSISSKFKAVEKISNITSFNTDAFNTWKSAFRECVKLSSRIIDRQKEDETQRRLQIWCTVGEDRKYGKYAIDGAKQGALYGTKNQSNKEKLKMINDFEWLQERFNARNI